MDKEESPLDVLSRAATMVSPPAYGESRNYSNKESPCSKWRRQKRQITNNKSVDAPLDFSTKHSSNIKPPPSYDQSMQNKMSRPSVIQSVCTVSPVTKNSQFVSKSSSSEDVCDPAIDEHFRRSLGKDYSSIFSKDKKTFFNKSEGFESDSTGLTVDDHFAKALGDTWLKLKEKENEEKLSSAFKSNNNNLMMRIKGKSNENNDVNKKRKKRISKEVVLSEKKKVAITSNWVKT